MRSRGPAVCVRGLAGSRCGSTHLSPLPGSSSEEKAPLQMLPNEWLGFSLGSSLSGAGSLFFLLPKSFLKGWNLPAFFLSADEKTERRGAEDGLASARSLGGGRNERGQRASSARSSARSARSSHGSECPAATRCDATHSHSTARSVQTSALGLEDMQPNTWTNRKDNSAKPERNTAVVLGFIPQFGAFY